MMRRHQDSSQDPSALAPVQGRGAAEPFVVLSKPVGNVLLRLCKGLVIEKRLVSNCLISPLLPWHGGSILYC